MTITIPELVEEALRKEAERQGIPAELLVTKVLRDHFLPPAPPRPFEPRDDWERGLLNMAINCGVSLSDEAISRDSMYD